MINIINTYDINFTSQHNVIWRVVHVVQPVTLNNIQFLRSMIILNELIRLMT